MFTCKYNYFLTYKGLFYFIVHLKIKAKKKAT